MAEIAEGIARLVEGVDPRRDVLVDALPDIDRRAPVGIITGLKRRLPHRRPVGFLQCPVDETAAGAATEGQGARSLQNLDALRIVEIAEDLNVIAESVDEEVRAGIDAANDELVAVALALMHGD